MRSGFTNRGVLTGRELEKPEEGFRERFEDREPDLEDGRVDLVEIDRGFTNQVSELGATAGSTGKWLYKAR